MNEIDHLALDGHAIRLFLTVLDTNSVTEAADRLGLTQSAVSHALQRLRQITRDPLFVKSGRNIVATAHARALAEPARRLLEQMKALAAGAAFDPAKAQWSLTVAANDFQRDLLLPALFRRLSAVAPGVTLRAIPSARPSAELVRDGRCDLVISPLPPDGTDVMRKRLLRDRYVCFFDPAVRSAPVSREDYLAARHITVVYPDEARLDFDRRLEAAGIRRSIAVSVPSFEGVPAFLAGTDLLGTVPSLLGQRLMRDFARTMLPLDGMPADLAELPMYLVWHQRFQNDPAHIWLRGVVDLVAADVARL